MSENNPWKNYRTNSEGTVDVLRKPRMSFGRKMGIAVTALVSVPALALQADVIYSDANTTHTSSSIQLAKGSISCENADGVITVDAGYGIKNAGNTAEKVALEANTKNICTTFATYGTIVNIEELADQQADILRGSRKEQRAANPELKPNAIRFGMSLGGIVAARTQNRMKDKFGDEFNYPALVMDATPSNSEVVRWGNQTVAEMVARNCRYIRFGDLAMTLFTVLTDQNEARKSQLWDDSRRDEYLKTVYEATREAGMRLRVSQACIVGIGMPELNKTSETAGIYAYTDNDPIVDGSISKEAIKPKWNGSFEEVHMTGDGIDNNHAAPWDNWQAYERHYKGIINRIDQIIRSRENATWYRKAPHIPQPR